MDNPIKLTEKYESDGWPSLKTERQSLLDSYERMQRFPDWYLLPRSL